MVRLTQLSVAVPIPYLIPRRNFPGNCMQTASAVLSLGIKEIDRHEHSEAVPCMSVEIQAGVRVVEHTAVTMQSHLCLCMIGRKSCSLSLGGIIILKIDADDDRLSQADLTESDCRSELLVQSGCITPPHDPVIM